MTRKRQAKTFGDALRRLRESRGLSPYALAQRAGVTDQTVHNLESGTRKPLWETVLRLAQALGVTPDYFAREQGPFTLPEPTPGRPRGRPKKPPNKSTDQHKP